MSPDDREATATPDEQRAGELAERTRRRGALDAAKLLQAEDDHTIVNVLRKLNPATALHILDQLTADRRRAVVAAAPAELAARWELNHRYPDNSVGRLMETPKGVFPPEMTVGEAIQQVRELVKTTFVTYGYVIDPAGRLLGIITMRDLLVAEPATALRDLMLANPFSLRPEMPLLEAMKLVVVRHFPVYPVCENDGRLVGL